MTNLDVTKPNLMDFGDGSIGGAHSSDGDNSKGGADSGSNSGNFCMWSLKKVQIYVLKIGFPDG